MDFGIGMVGSLDATAESYKVIPYFIYMDPDNGQIFIFLLEIVSKALSREADSQKKRRLAETEEFTSHQ